MPRKDKLRNLCLSLVLARDECKENRSAILATCRGVRLTARKRSALWKRFTEQLSEGVTNEMWEWQFEDIFEEEETVEYKGEISVERATQIAWASFLVAKDKKTRQLSEQQS